MSNEEEPIAIPKAEHSDLESFSESSPEPDDPHFIQEVAQVQKRKGGRKPVCPHLLDDENFLTGHDPDLCNIRGKKAKEPSSPSSIS